MDNESVKRLESALLEFVERTSKKATSDTEVAAVLVEILKLQ